MNQQKANIERRDNFIPVSIAHTFEEALLLQRLGYNIGSNSYVWLVSQFMTSSTAHICWHKMIEMNLSIWLTSEYKILVQSNQRSLIHQ